MGGLRVCAHYQVLLVLLYIEIFHNNNVEEKWSYLIVQHEIFIFYPTTRKRNNIKNIIRT